jgi:hypothetical protein
MRNSILKPMATKTIRHWQKDWRVARAGEIYIVGRNSEPAGNLTCRASFDGSAFSLSLRVPPALEAQFGKYVSLSGIRFHHGTAAILAAISPPDVPATKSHKATAPVTYRFVRPRDGKGWILRVHACHGGEGHHPAPGGSNRD